MKRRALGWAGGALVVVALLFVGMRFWTAESAPPGREAKRRGAEEVEVGDDAKPRPARTAPPPPRLESSGQSNEQPGDPGLGERPVESGAAKVVRDFSPPIVSARAIEKLRGHRELSSESPHRVVERNRSVQNQLLDERTQRRRDALRERIAAAAPAERVRLQAELAILERNSRGRASLAGTAQKPASLARRPAE